MNKEFYRTLQQIEIIKDYQLTQYGQGGSEWGTIVHGICVKCTIESISFGAVLAIPASVGGKPLFLPMDQIIEDPPKPYKQ